MRARELLAEAVGTFALVTTACGAQLLSSPAAGPLVPAVATGLAYLALATALAPVSGAHFNPAVTLGLIAAGRLDSSRAPGFVAAQCAGALAAVGLIALALSGPIGGRSASVASLAGAYGARHALLPVLALQVALTGVLLVVFVGAGGRRSTGGAGPLAIGAALCACELIAVPVWGGGLNPARSLATALPAGLEAVARLWIFWVAPILGAVVGGVLGRYLCEDT